MQLVAYGAQDIYLTGNPQITFFKVVYRRHTNFSMESIQQTFSGVTEFGNSVTATISRNGDLVYRMYLEHEAKLKSADASNNEIGVVSNYGSRLIKEAELEIGGQRIDRQYGHWHETYYQLTETNESSSVDTLYHRLTGNGEGKISTSSVVGWTAGANGAGDTLEGKFWIPLYFWFCRNPGLALPLIALQYHEVKVKLELEAIGNLAVVDTDGNFSSGGNTAAATKSANDNGSSFDLWADYIYLDTDERRRFAQVSHEYLIEQVQHQTISSTGNFTEDINFNHPVKELIWRNVNQAIPASDLAADGTSYLGAPLAMDGNFLLKLNGHDRFKERDYRYFTRTQIWQHHTGYGGYIGQTSSATVQKDVIAVYSFALKPEEHQPSGTCNFSRIDNAQLIRRSSSATMTGGLDVYAVNYNVLRIMSGMGGLAYSN